jgi:hypothetical protein
MSVHYPEPGKPSETSYLTVIKGINDCNELSISVNQLGDFVEKVSTLNYHQL